MLAAKQVARTVGSVTAERPTAEAIAIDSDVDIVRARQHGRQLAAELGFGTADQTRLATAISELARNALKYGGGGSCVVIDESDATQIRIRVTIIDEGPGIPDIEQAMEDGFSTGKSLGAGLPGAKRLVTEMTLQSEPGHTEVSVMLERTRP